MDNPLAELAVYVHLLDSCTPSKENGATLTEALQILDAHPDLVQTRLGGEIYRIKGDYYKRRFEEDLRNLDSIEALMAQTRDESPLQKVLAGMRRSTELYGDSSFMDEAPENLTASHDGYRAAAIIAEWRVQCTGDEAAQDLRQKSMRGLYSNMVDWLNFCYRMGNHIINNVHESAEGYIKDSGDPNIRITSPFEPLATAFEIFERSTSVSLRMVDKYYHMATELYNGMESVALALKLTDTREARVLRDKAEEMHNKMEETKRIWEGVRVNMLGSN